MQNNRTSWNTIGILAFTQVVSWGALYYAFAILAPEMQREFGWRAEVVFGAFSWSLLVAGVVSTPVGVFLDRFGGRAVMGIGSLTCGVGFISLSLAHSILLYFLAWTVLGVAMAMVLYEAAFATINRVFVVNPRKAISTLTLFGGFASTLFWPLTLKLNSVIGWRETYLVYGVLQLVLCAPLHALLNPGGRPASAPLPATHAKSDYSLQDALRHPAFWKLALAFSANSFVFSALSVHLIPLLHQFGHALTTAVLMATLIGPMQVAGRIGEMTFGSRASPQTVDKLIFSVLPVALLALLLLGRQQVASAAFCVLYGLSNGIMTIVRGTIPQALFGRENYGAISGALAGPALVSKAAGPIAIAAVVQVTPSPYPLIGVLLAFSLFSLICYLAAVQVSKDVIGETANLSD